VLPPCQERRQYGRGVTIEPVIISPEISLSGREARGTNLVIEDWCMDQVSEVAPLHVHRADDEAWLVVSGELRFRFADRQVVAIAGSTVLVPAGVAHTFGNAGPGPSRFIIVLPVALNALIHELHAADPDRHADIYRRYHSELLE
jgi:quercetin dioxygenase-like cupin family protein